MLTRFAGGVCLVMALASCAATRHIPQPILEQDHRAVSADDAIVSDDLRDCRAEVLRAAPVSMQPRWLPPTGTTANGVVLGSSDAPHPVWPSRDAYRQAMERCLTGHGYSVEGWQ